MDKQKNITDSDLLMRFADYFQGEDKEVVKFSVPKAVENIHSFTCVLKAAHGILHSHGKHFSTVKHYDVRLYAYDKNAGQHNLKKGCVPPKEEQVRIKCTKVGRDLLNALEQYRDPGFLQLMQRIKPSPEVELFSECVAKSDILISQCQHKQGGQPDIKALVALYDEFSNKFRLAAKSTEFKAAVNANKRRCNKNRQGIEKLIDSIFRLYSRVVVIRLDCTYKRPDGMDDDQFNRRITVEQARKDLTAFMKKNAPHGLWEHLIAYVIKMEMGPRKGIHFHVMMFFDGRHHREDITIATTLGKYWEHVTNGRGMFYNCNKKWKGKPQCAVGTIHRDDKILLAALKERVVTYLTKIDTYFQFLPLISGRTLFRSKVKKARNPKVMAVEANQDKVTA